MYRVVRKRNVGVQACGMVFEIEKHGMLEKQLQRREVRSPATTNYGISTWGKAASVKSNLRD